MVDELHSSEDSSWSAGGINDEVLKDSLLVVVGPWWLAHGGWPMVADEGLGMCSI